MFKYLKKLNKKSKKNKNSKENSSIFTKNLAYIYLKNPHITEKATFLSEINQYVFKIKNNSNKIEIKSAIEDLYEVDVVSVNIIKIPAKKKRIGRIDGQRSGYKKAIIKIKKGQKIEFI